MPSRGLPIVPARRCLCREDLVPGPAHEPTTSLCEIAWPDGSHRVREEHSLQLRKHKFRALRGVRLSRSREEPAPRAEAETGTITHSCANAWQAKFADLSIALLNFSRKRSPLWRLSQSRRVGHK